METLLETSYRSGFVVLSYVFAVVGSFIALTSARDIVRRSGRIDWLATTITGVALGGIGVWSMHFLGMLAVQIDIGVGYRLLETLTSLVAAVCASSAALVYVAKAPSDPKRIVVAGCLLGLGVAVMHYLGMYGMRFGGFIRWSPEIVALSVLIAMVAATAALWLAFNVGGIGPRAAASAVMGIAVCAMHYTGMSAAGFICTTANRLAVPSGSGVIASFNMPTMVVLITIGTAMIIVLDLVMRREEAKTRAMLAQIRKSY